MFAQTSIQLYRQIIEEGYSSKELKYIHDAYQLAKVLSSGQLRPSGKSNIDHLVGTASILSSLRVPVEIVTAGLLHSIYNYGDFGFWYEGISDKKRRIVQKVVGHETEEYIARYTGFKWGHQTINTLYEDIDKLNEIDRTLILLRLVNLLDDIQENEILYCSNAEDRKNFCLEFRKKIISIAERLGYPDLASNIAESIQMLEEVDFPEFLRESNKSIRLYSIPPKSYRRKVWVAIAQESSRIIILNKSFVKKLIKFIHTKLYRVKVATLRLTK